MMQMHNSPQGEQNPDAVFQGLGLRGWLRLVFRTRAGTIKQCDATIELMFGKLNDACLQAAMAAKSAAVAENAADIAQKAAQKFATLVLQQNEALVMVEKKLTEWRSIWTDEDLCLLLADTEEVYSKVTEALTAAKSHI